ncbi:cold-shock protein [Rhizobium sp. SAFR-030]|uniref:cold-shock protein n=1 Tax=Rhizobium sp. SAFR-030 TaxID=3387277 RepID=UPI003F81BECF
MGAPSFAVGDTIVLKTAQSGVPSGNCRISAVLPAAYGHVQYRIRFDGETFERRIVESDIDRERSTRSAHVEKTVSPAKGRSWLNPTSMKIGK